MDIIDPRSPHLVGAHADYCRLPSSTGAAPCVLPLVLRGRCSALQDPGHLVPVAGCGPLSVASHHATPILAHAFIEQEYIENVKPAKAQDGVAVKKKRRRTRKNLFPPLSRPTGYFFVLPARHRTAVQTEIVECVIQEV